MLSMRTYQLFGWTLLKQSVQELHSGFQPEQTQSLQHIQRVDWLVVHKIDSERRSYRQHKQIIFPSSFSNCAWSHKSIQYHQIIYPAT